MQYDTYLELGNPIPSWLIIIITKNSCFCDLFTHVSRKHRPPTPNRIPSQEIPRTPKIKPHSTRGYIPNRKGERKKDSSLPHHPMVKSKILKLGKHPPKNGLWSDFRRKECHLGILHLDLSARFSSERSHIAAHPLHRSGQAEARGFPVHVTLVELRVILWYFI